MPGPHLGRLAHGSVVTVKGDVEVSETDGADLLLADQPVQPGGEGNAAGMNADQRHGAAGIALDDLMRHPSQSPLHVRGIEDES